jgi:hypothetical protein
MNNCIIFILGVIFGYFISSLVKYNRANSNFTEIFYRGFVKNNRPKSQRPINPPKGQCGYNKR